MKAIKDNEHYELNIQQLRPCRQCGGIFNTKYTKKRLTTGEVIYATQYEELKNVEFYIFTCPYCGKPNDYLKEGIENE